MISLETLRQLRIGPFSFFDTATAYFGILLIAPLLTKLFSKIGLYINRIQWLWLTLPIAVLFHLLLRLNTPLIKMLMHFPSGIFIAIVLIVMLYLGLKDIRNPKNI
jgi:hypothetical protein